MIRLVDIVKTFTVPGGTVKALDGVSVDIGDKEIVGIVGTSGAGKSTLVRCINLLERPDSGQVIVDGVDLMSLSKRQLQEKRKEMGMIFQHFNLMSQRTVFGNAAFPIAHNRNKAYIKEKVTGLLELVGIADKANAYPAQLSGGQKQRAAIARALAAEPRILLCDEATSALDSETTKSILKLLRDINKKLGITIVIITHQKEVVKDICHNIVVINGGKVAESGSVLDMFTIPKTPAGKAFAGDILEDERITVSLREQRKINPGSTFMKLTFLGERSSDPVISAASKRFDVLIGIIYGNIETIQEQTVGVLLVKADGSPANIAKTQEYFAGNGIISEII